MQNLIQYILDILFPPRTEESLVRKLSPARVLTYYQKQSHDGIITLSRFSHTHIRALIHEAKFHNNEHAHHLLALLLQKYLETIPKDTPLNIIPIPLSATRERTRGYNQVLRILERLDRSNLTLIQILPHALIRTKDTPPQTTLKRSERLTNMAHAFTAIHPKNLVDKHILLIDDVTTTGATLRAAKAALLPHSPASVTCLALAH